MAQRNASTWQRPSDGFPSAREGNHGSVKATGVLHRLLDFTYLYTEKVYHTLWETGRLEIMTWRMPCNLTVSHEPIPTLLCHVLQDRIANYLTPVRIRLDWSIHDHDACGQNTVTVRCNEADTLLLSPIVARNSKSERRLWGAQSRWATLWKAGRN